MKIAELNLDRPEDNLAADEFLLDLAESGHLDQDLIRFWHSEQYFVVLGYSNRIGEEVREANCRDRGIPVLRRCTGGGTVLQGPGCLNYSLVMRIPESGPLTGIKETNQFLMNSLHAALQPALNHPIRVAGHTDLALGQRKFSGNAQRRRSRWVLFHGTFLLDMDLQLMETCLPLPRQQPAYREGRSHPDFLTNLPLAEDVVRSQLLHYFQVKETMLIQSTGHLCELVSNKYAQPNWIRRF
jgi:lipoate---protein ligase